MKPSIVARAGRKEWMGLAVIALPCLLFSVDINVLNLAVPQLVSDLHPSSAQLLWIIDIYGFFLAASLITMGVLGDRIGQRRLLLIGASLFTLGSVAAAFSRTIETLIIARACMGMAAATLTPSTLALIRTMFQDSTQRTRAMSIWIASFSVGGAVGPPLGGLLLTYFWWGSVFLVAVPIMLLLVIAGPRLLPECKGTLPGKLDLLSASLSVAAILPIIYGIQQLAQNGWAITSVLAIGAGLVLAALFIIRQSKLTQPFIDLTLFRSATFSTALLLTVISFFVNFSTSLFVAQYLQSVLGINALRAGLWMLPAGVGFLAGSLSTPLLTRRFRTASIAAGGFGLAAISLAMIALAPTYGLGMVVVGFGLFSLGLAPVVTVAITLLVSAAPAGQAGAAAGIGQTGGQFGGALGVAVLGSISTAVYHHKIVVGLSAAVRNQLVGSAQNNIGSTLSVAHHLPHVVQQFITIVARQAFSSAFRLVLVLGSVLLVMAAIAASILGRALRNHTSKLE